MRISVICLTGELYICRKIAEETGGSFAVAMDSNHLVELLTSHTVPPPERLIASDISVALLTDFVYMGFPKRTFAAHSSFLLNHDSITLSSTSYMCPRCFTRTSELPSDCKACGLSLNSSANIARSYHHLFPVNNYVEYSIDSTHSVRLECKGCLERLSNTNLIMQCPTCCELFCVDCDLFIHESLHNCPGCPS